MRVWGYESTAAPSPQGTVVGEYVPDGCFLWVRWDGETEPRQMRWHEIRPVDSVTTVDLLAYAEHVADAARST
jgi:hypothetical protein